MVPIIGVSPRLIKISDIDRIAISHRLFTAFATEKVELKIIPFQSVALPEILSGCQGYILGGGDDVDPSFYHQPKLAANLTIDQRIDHIDRIIIDYAFVTRKPLLGICRGMQAINVFLGGSLWQDLGPLNTFHQHQMHPLIAHGQTLFCNLIRPQIEVYSAHHQAIHHVAPGCLVRAHWNGVIEAIEHQSKPILGVQWHPEVDPKNPINESVIHYFLAWF